MYIYIYIYVHFSEISKLEFKNGYNLQVQMNFFSPMVILNLKVDLSSVILYDCWLDYSTLNRSRSAHGLNIWTPVKKILI